MRLSSPVIRELEYILRFPSCNYVGFPFSLSPFCFLALRFYLSHFIPRHLVYSILYRLAGPACGRASARHICIPLNVVNLSKREPLYAESPAALQSPWATFAVFLQRMSGKTKHQRTEARPGISSRAIIPNESTDLRALNGD